MRTSPSKFCKNKGMVFIWIFSCPDFQSMSNQSVVHWMNDYIEEIILIKLFIKLNLFYWIFYIIHSNTKFEFKYSICCIFKFTNAWKYTIIYYKMSVCSLNSNTDLLELFMFNETECFTLQFFTVFVIIKLLLDLLRECL